MRSLLAMTAAAAVVLGLGTVDAKAHGSHDAALVQSWYHRYLHRAPDPAGLHTWVSALRNGSSSEEVQASILASEEYFCQHGHSNHGFVAHLYTDVLGRSACATEIEGWLHRMQRVSCRTQLSREFLAAAGPELHRRAAHGTRHVPVVETRPVFARSVVPHLSHRHVAPVVPVPVAPSRGVRVNLGYAGR